MDNKDINMITIYWKLSIGFPGAIRKGEFEIEADATEQEIEEGIRDSAFEYIDYWRTDEHGEPV